MGLVCLVQLIDRRSPSTPADRAQDQSCREMPHTTSLPDLYFGGPSLFLAAFILPIWLLKIAIIEIWTLTYQISLNVLRANPAAWIETSTNTILSRQNSQAEVESTVEFRIADRVVPQIIARVQAAASEVLMHAYANRRTGQIHIDMSEGNSGDSPAEEDDLPSEPHPENDTERRRMDFARLRQTISQNEDAQTICTYFAALLPFVGLFALKAVVDNYGDIIRLLLGFLSFMSSDQYIQAAVAGVRPSVQQRLSLASVLIFGFLATSNTIAPVEDYDLWKVLTFRYAGEHYHSFTNTLLIIVLTDNFIKMVTIVCKLVVVCIPGVTAHQKRRNYQCIEYMSQFYRCLFPIVQWISYLLGNEYDATSVFNGTLAVAYFCLKMREAYLIGKITLQSFQRVFETSNYGMTPTQAEIDENSMCSICHDRLDSPTKLSCSHMFCHSCIDTWLDKEHTCPMCRAVVDKKDNSFKSGATSKNIRFY